MGLKLKFKMGGVSGPSASAQPAPAPTSGSPAPAAPPAQTAPQPTYQPVAGPSQPIAGPSQPVAGPSRMPAQPAPAVTQLSSAQQTPARPPQAPAKTGVARISLVSKSRPLDSGPPPQQPTARLQPTLKVKPPSLPPQQVPQYHPPAYHAPAYHPPTYPQPIFKKPLASLQKRKPMPGRKFKPQNKKKSAQPSIIVRSAWDGDQAGSDDSSAAGAGRFKGQSRTLGGVTYRLVDDELSLPEDPQGDTKIDKNGNLLGGRRFVMPCLTSTHRPNPNRQYMLSIDAARCAGFRDSMQFFKRNPLLVKIMLTQDEKNELIAQGKLHQNMRPREVTMATAHSLFKVFGARFVADGKYVTDDYYEELSRSQGRVPGQSADVPRYDPDIDTGTFAKPKVPGMTVAGGPLSSKPIVFAGAAPAATVQSTFGSAGVTPFGKTWAREHHQRSKRVYSDLTPRNWMLRYALDVAQTNDAIARWRADNTLRVDLGTDAFEPELAAEPQVKTEPDAMNVDETSSTALSALQRQPRSPVHGVFEAHTNVPHVPLATQPTSARLEWVAPLPRLGTQPALLGHYGSATRSTASEESEIDADVRGAAARAGVCSVELRIVDRPPPTQPEPASAWAFDFGVAQMIEDQEMAV